MAFNLFGASKKDSGNSRTDHETHSNISDFADSTGNNSANYSPTEIGDIKFGKQSDNNTFTITTADYGSIGQAFEVVDDAFEEMSNNQANVFEYAAGMQEAQNETALDFLDFADQETDDVLEFAAGATEAAYSDVEDSREWGAGLVGAVLGTNEANQERQYAEIENARASVDNMLEWSGGFINEILDSSEANQENLRLSHTANTNALIAGHSSQIAGMQSNFNNSMEFAAGAFDRSMSTVENAAAQTANEAKSVLNGMADYTTNAVAQAGANMSAGIDAIKNAAKSESATMNDTLIKGGAVVGVSLIALTMWMNRK